MNRRRLLHGTGVLLAGALGGCARFESSESASSPTGTAASSDSPTATATERPAATSTDTPTKTAAAERVIYISEVLANPGGPDTEAVTDEYVLVEMNADAERDLSGYTLAYGQQHEYVFSDRVSAVEPGATVEVVSGRGSDAVSGSERPTYTLFVGSDTPLLDNDGMRLRLTDPEGATVDTLTYGAMSEGSLYVQPET